VGQGTAAKAGLVAAFRRGDCPTQSRRRARQSHNLNDASFNACEAGRFRENFNDWASRSSSGPRGCVSTPTPTGLRGATIGYGHTLGVRIPMTITPGEAERLLLEDMARQNGISNCLCGAPTNSKINSQPCESLAYNIGLRQLRNIHGHQVSQAPEIHGRCIAANAFLLWNKANKQVLPGLTRRREDERELYLS
jgi:lysozyme